MAWFVGIAALLLAIIVSLVASQREQQNQQHERLQEIHSRLISHVSHDLRNPIIAQRNMLEILASASDQISLQLLKEQHHLMLASSYAQLELLQNITCWARLELGILVYTPIKVSLNAVLNEAISQVRPMAKHKRIDISTQVPPMVVAYADKAMVVNMLRNLIANAIKFSQSDSCVEVVVTDFSPQLWAIAVSDHGVGIDSERLSVLLTSHEPVGYTLGTQGEQGVGLGLTICRKIAALHQCDLRADSQLNDGSTFTFTLAKATDE